MNGINDLFSLRFPETKLIINNRKEMGSLRTSIKKSFSSLIKAIVLPFQQASNINKYDNQEVDLRFRTFLEYY